MNIELDYWPLGRLTPYEANTKIHTEVDVELIAQSIERFGFNDPIGVDPDGEIIEGHGRLMAARMLGLEEVPVIILPDLTDKQKRLYRIAHNKIALRSNFDLNILVSILEDISGGDISLSALGFTDAALTSLRWADEQRMRRIEGEREAEDSDLDDTMGPEHEAPEQAAIPTAEIVWDSAEQKDRWKRFCKTIERLRGQKGTGALIGYIEDSGIIVTQEADDEQRTQTSD